MKKQKKTSQLYVKDVAVDFYQERYLHGYMYEWPSDKKKRIFEVIRSLGLPDVGEAIDFGCGNGVLTDVIKQALPCGWKVYGTDISSIAIEDAKKRYPDYIFYEVGDREFIGKRFDFLFSHHVLEHVYNLSLILDEIDNILKDEAAILHILPCGNEGSFLHSICLLRKDGINPMLGNRFFCDDEGHVRRLNTEQISKLYRERGYFLAKENYSDQYYGAINWITTCGPSFMLSFFDTSSAIDEKAKSKLKRLGYKMFIIWALRYPTAFIEGRLLLQRRITVRDCLFLIFALPLYIFTKPMDLYLKSKSLDEWQKRKTERNGSEMYLFLTR